MSANTTAVRTSPLSATTPEARKSAMVAILPKLQAAKAAHLAAWKASQDAQVAYARLRDEYSAICGLVRKGK